MNVKINHGNIINMGDHEEFEVSSARNFNKNICYADKKTINQNNQNN